MNKSLVDNNSDISKRLSEQKPIHPNLVNMEDSEMSDVTMSTPIGSLQAQQRVVVNRNISSLEHEDLHYYDEEEELGLNQSISSRISRNITRIRTSTMRSIHEVNCDDRNSSSFVAGWNVSNLIQGIGIVGIPYAVRVGGWAALAVIALTAAACCYTGRLLIECLYEMCPVNLRRVRYLKTYYCIGEKVWPRFGRQLVTGVMLVEMIGGMTLYIILMAKMSSTLMKDLIPQLDIYYWSLITTYSSLPLLFVNRMSVVSWFSLIAVIGLLSTIGTILGYCFAHATEMSFANVPPFDISTFPISVGIIVFSYCAHGVFPSIEASMRWPESYPFMLRVSFAVAVITKVVMGITAVLIFGSNTEQEVTVNMESNYGFGIAVCILVFVNVFFSVPLVVFVIIERINCVLLPYFHPAIQDGGRFHFVWKLITLLILLTFTLLVAMLVPHFALLMGFVGSITGTCLSFIFPCWFHIVLKKDSLTRIGIGIRICIILFGIVIGIFGAIFSGKRILATFSAD